MPTSSKIPFLKHDLIAGVIGLIACLLLDRVLIYFAGYKLWRDGHLLRAMSNLMLLVVAIVLTYCLIRTLRGSIGLTLIKAVLLLCVAIYFVSKFYGQDMFLRGFRDRMATTGISPQALQAWATEIVQQESVDDWVKSISQDRLPQQLKMLTRSPGILLRQDNRGKFIELMFGRSWGIYVGGANFRIRSDYEHIEWIPGVYLFVAGAG